MLKLDSMQAGCFGAGLLLCLAFQVAIVVVLLKQRQLQPVQIAPFPPAYERLMHAGDRPTAIAGVADDRTTAIADLASDAGLWEIANASIGHKWQLEEDNLRKQEAAIVEELVSKNVTWAQELAQS